MYISINLEILYTAKAIEIIIIRRPIIVFSFNARYPTMNIIAITARKNSITKIINGYLNHFGVFRFLLSSNEPSKINSIMNSIISSIFSLPIVLYHVISILGCILFFIVIGRSVISFFWKIKKVTNVTLIIIF